MVDLGAGGGLQISDGPFNFKGHGPDFTGIGIFDRYGLGQFLPALQGADGVIRPLPAGPFFDEDRKSTRLNSSHVRTSYAVFCLQKKTCRRFSASFPAVTTPPRRAMSSPVGGTAKRSSP